LIPLEAAMHDDYDFTATFDFDDSEWKAIDDALAGGQAQTVHRWVGQRDHGDVAVDFVFSGHAVVPWKVKKNDRAIFIVDNAAGARLSRLGQAPARVFP
jgi:hypothetical protein